MHLDIHLYDHAIHTYMVIILTKQNNSIVCHFTKLNLLFITYTYIT